MKILMVSNLYPPYYMGGYELRCALVAEGMHQRGHDVKVLTSRFGLSSTQPLRESIRGVEVQRLLGQYHHGPQQPVDWPLFLLRKYVNKRKHPMVHHTVENFIGVRPQLRDVRCFIRIVDEFKPDVINWWSVGGLTKALLPVPKLKGIPDIFCVEDDWIIEERSLDATGERPPWAYLWQQENNPRYWRLFTNWLMAMWKARLHKKGIVTYPVPFYPDHVSFVSEFLRLDYAAAGLSFPSSEVIYGGVPADKFFCQRWLPAGDLEPISLLYSGQITRDRGLHTIIEAIDSLPLETRSLVTLTVAGDSLDRQYVQEIHEQVRVRDLSEKVVFLGQKSYEQMPRIYRCHDVLIAPSLRKEGLPLNMVEAMLSGCAVVTTGSGGAMEIAQLADLPLFPKGNALVLRGLLERLMANRLELRRIAIQGQEVALREFSSDRMVDHFCAAFQSLYEQKKRRKIGDYPIVQKARKVRSAAHGRGMKILNISPMYLPIRGGAERHAQEVSERLVSRGHQVTVVTTNVTSGHDLWYGLGGALEKTESINGVRVVRVPAADGALPGNIKLGLGVKWGHRSLNQLFTPAGLEVLSRPPRNLGFLWSILRSNADLVVAWNWYWPPAYQAYLAKSFKHLRLIGVPLFHTAENWAQRSEYKAMIAACDALVVNSSHEKEFIIEREPGAQRIATLGVGIAPELFARRDGGAFRRHYGINGKPLIGFVGRMDINKNVDRIVDAMSFVWQWNKEVCLVIAGFLDAPYPELDRALGRLGANQRSQVLLIRDISESEKVDLYDALDVFVMPSVGESFGITYLEAWMCRKAVIGARIGSTACVIDEGTNGVLVLPHDSRDISRAVIGLLADPDSRSRMGQRGYEKTIKQFTWDKICDGMEELLLELIREKSVPDRWRRRGNSFSEAAIPRKSPIL